TAAVVVFPKFSADPSEINSSFLCNSKCE
ncbi:hypothetical protein CCACVL1_00908, partial [Corchorus capsularis]